MLENETRGGYRRYFLGRRTRLLLDALPAPVRASMCQIPEAAPPDRLYIQVNTRGGGHVFCNEYLFLEDVRVTKRLRCFD